VTQFLIARITSQAPTADDAWIGKLVQLLRNVIDHTRIINANESCWRLYRRALKTLTPTASHNVQLVVSGNENDSFTVMTAFRAARTKLPLYMIVAGKPALVEHSHFGDLGFHTTHSESGCQTAETFVEWLSWLRSMHNDGEPIWLILDGYSVYRDKAMRGSGDPLITYSASPDRRAPATGRLLVWGKERHLPPSLSPNGECNTVAGMDQEIAALDNVWSLYKGQDE
jgi:hypothetical protein